MLGDHHHLLLLSTVLTTTVVALAAPRLGRSDTTWHHTNARHGRLFGRARQTINEQARLLQRLKQGDDDKGEDVEKVAGEDADYSAMHRLKDDLLARYDPTVRPSRNVTRVTEMFVAMGILALLNVDETESKLRAFVSTELYWTDEYLRWRPTDYDNLTTVTIPLHLLWSPDLMCDQTIEVKRPIEADRELVRVEHTGAVTYLALHVHEFACPMESANFPFDNQTCPLTYGSYGYDSSQLRFGAEAQLHSTRDAHPEWIITGFSAEHDTTSSAFSQMHLRLCIQRRPAFYVITLMYPSSLITLLSILGMFTPGEASLNRDEKINVAMSTLLTLSVLLIVVADIIPKSQANYPQIGTFFFAQIGSIVGHTVVATVIMYVNTLAQWGVPFPDALLPCATRHSTSPTGSETLVSLRPKKQLAQNNANDLKQANGSVPVQVSATSTTAAVLQPPAAVHALNELVQQVGSIRRQLQTTDADDNQTNWNRLCFVLDTTALVVFVALQAALTVAYCSHDGQMIIGILIRLL